MVPKSSAPDDSSDRDSLAPMIDNILRAFHNLAQRWPFVGVSTALSPPVECLFAEMREKIPILPIELITQGLGRGTLGWREPVALAPVYLNLRSIGATRFDEMESVVEEGRVLQAATKISTLDGEGPPRARFSAQYFFFYDLRGLSSDPIQHEFQRADVAAAWDSFEHAVTQLDTYIVLQTPQMGGLTKKGGLHTGHGTPKSWRDSQKWLYFLFQGLQLEELNASPNEAPWLLSRLSKNVGDASIDAVLALPELETAGQKKNRTPDTKPDTGKKKLRFPDSPELRRLIRKLKRGCKQVGVRQIDIAREFTNGDEERAENILRQAREYKDLWHPKHLKRKPDT